MTTHQGFWSDLAGRIGAPIFSATIVVCLLQRVYDPLHLALLGVGLALMGYDHWARFHRSRG